MNTTSDDFDPIYLLADTDPGAMKHMNIGSRGWIPRHSRTPRRRL